MSLELTHMRFADQKRYTLNNLDIYAESDFVQSVAISDIKQHNLARLGPRLINSANRLPCHDSHNLISGSPNIQDWKLKLSYLDDLLIIDYLQKISQNY